MQTLNGLNPCISLVSETENLGLDLTWIFLGSNCSFVKEEELDNSFG